jgi:hypothetical protein
VRDPRPGKPPSRRLLALECACLFNLARITPHTMMFASIVGTLIAPPREKHTRPTQQHPDPAAVVIVTASIQSAHSPWPPWLEVRAYCPLGWQLTTRQKGQVIAADGRVWLQRERHQPAETAPHFILIAEDLQVAPAHAQSQAVLRRPARASVRGKVGTIETEEDQAGRRVALALEEAVPPLPGQQSGPVNLIGHGYAAELLACHEAGDTLTATGELIAQAAPGRPLRREQGRPGLEGRVEPQGQLGTGRPGAASKSPAQRRGDRL